MSIVICSHCTLPYVPATRSRVCLVCWKENEGYDLTKADEAHVRLANATKHLMDENARLKAASSAANSTSTAELQKTVNELQAKLKEFQNSPALTPDLIKTLITLCHPDKHANSTTSTEVTKKLIALRPKK